MRAQVTTARKVALIAAVLAVVAGEAGEGKHGPDEGFEA